MSGRNGPMATIEKIERDSGFFSGESFEIHLTCGHSFKVDEQPEVRVGDDFPCPICRS